MYVFLALLLLCFPVAVHCDYCVSDLFKDMLIVDYWNRRINDRLPVTFNHLLQGGYVNMPSARMGCEGEVGVGYSSVPPYRNYALRCQLIDQLEVSGIYRIFRGVEDPILSPLGFGDLSDKGVNLKVALFSPEDSGYKLPGVAVGYDDVLGTRNFETYYAVLTKVFLDYDCEATLGYGKKRISGFFGGFAWFPFRRCGNPYLKDFNLVAEYDAIPYHRHSIEKHPKGRVKKTPFNFGLKYRLWDYFDFSLGYVRGDALAFSASTFYNFGNTKGFLPKFEDVLPYQAPLILEPIGPRRPEDAFVQDLVYALRKQGFDLLEVTSEATVYGEQVLRLHILNLVYLNEQQVRTRLNYLLAGIIPMEFSRVIVQIDAEGFPVQEYRYDMVYIEQFREHQMCLAELRTLTPLREISDPCPGSIVKRLFKQNRNLWNLEVLPKTLSFFGSAKGKFKYALGLNFGMNGYLWDNLYYSVRLGYLFSSNLSQISSVDRLNPSQLPNVRTDIIDYFKTTNVTFDELYIQRTWNLRRGWYTRAALGYFEEEYGGFATEALYYPVDSCWAVGIEGALLGKRKKTGLWFTNRIRQFEGFVPRHHRFIGSQYFLDLYYEWREAKLDFKAMIGKFLANDKGARFEVTRYFPSGFRISLWYTVTDGGDRINGQTYFDKGVAFSMPLDIFYTYSDRSRWGYGMSAWLRDVGVFADTGLRLYNQIREQRVD